jgi:ATP-binding cassette, subfamily G (WHITE), member 2, SNQ2
VEQGKNVAEFLIEVGVGVLKSKSNPQTDFNEVWRKSPQAAVVQSYIESTCCKESKVHVPSSKSQASTFAASTYTQTLLLTQRLSRQYWRTPEYPYSRLYASFLHALLNGFTFFQLGSSITDLQSRMFACFLILMLVPEFMNATSMRFISNRDIWESREYPSRIYGWTAFAISNILAELPYAVVGAVLFFVVFYFPVGLPLGEQAGYTFLMVLLFHLFATSWGQWVGALRFVFFFSPPFPLLSYNNANFYLQQKRNRSSKSNALPRHYVRAFQRCITTTIANASCLEIHHVLRSTFYLLDWWYPLQDALWSGSHLRCC